MNRQRAVSLATRINPGDPESAGLVACFVTTPGGMLDLVAGLNGTRVGTDDPTRSTEHGTLETYYDAVADAWEFGSASLFSTTAPWSIVWEAQLDGFTDQYPTLAHFNNSSGGNEFQVLYSNAVSYTDISFGSSGGWARGRALLPNGIAITDRHWGVLTFDGVSSTTIGSFAVFLNGFSCTTSASAIFGATSGNNSIGSAPSVITQNWLGGIRQVRVYNRQWSHAEAQRFFDPRTRDRLFAPRSARIYSFAPPAAGGRTGTLAATESGSDTAAFAGDVIVQGALSATEAGSDTAAFAGDVIVAGALASTESGADTAALAGTVLVHGSLAATESGADTAAVAGDVLVQGALAATESGSDTAAFLGSGTTPAITGTIAATETGADVAALAGVVRISGAFAATETGADTAAFTSGGLTTNPKIIAITDVTLTIRTTDASATIRATALPDWPRAA